VGIEPSAQLVDFRLENKVPLDVVRKVAILFELMVFLKKFFAVREGFVIVSNNFS
jgi:hypothetical protein